jgi:hypothetical protein
MLMPITVAPSGPLRRFDAVAGVARPRSGHLREWLGCRRATDWVDRRSK